MVFKKSFFNCLIFVLCTSSLVATEQVLPCQTNPFIIITIAKGGSHLIFKLVSMLSTNPQRNLTLEPSFLNGETHTFPPHKYATLDQFEQKFPSLPYESIQAHMNHGRLLREFTAKHQDYVKIVMIRDPRDVCVSTVFYIDFLLKQLLGEGASFDEKLMFVIKSEDTFKYSVFNIKKQVREALRWMSDPASFVFRFENLCGSLGGGSDSLLESDILKLANTLNVNLTAMELEQIKSNLWGGTPTFRKGQTGEWKNYFKQKHKKAFKKQIGKFLIKMGYEKNNNW